MGYNMNNNGDRGKNAFCITNWYKLHIRSLLQTCSANQIVLNANQHATKEDAFSHLTTSSVLKFFERGRNVLRPGVWLKFWSLFHRCWLFRDLCAKSLPTWAQLDNGTCFRWSLDDLGIAADSIWAPPGNGSGSHQSIQSNMILLRFLHASRVTPSAWRKSQVCKYTCYMYIYICT